MKRLIAKLALVTALAAIALVGSQHSALATGGPLHCPNTGGPAAVGACHTWCLSHCTTRSCYGDCVDLNCVCP